MTVEAALPARSRTFFGEPRALAYLAFTEAWERFSYYGMVALLVLYLTHQLLLPGHVENIAGFAAFRHGLEAIFGPMSTLALASQIVGFYTGFVYFTPVLGGLVADRWLGRRRAVMLGAVLMSAGHIAMAFDVSFLVALLLLIVGCGLLKGNISTQVGALYADSDGEGRDRGFTIYSMGINVGSVMGPLLCGLLADLYGWHAGFGLAGVLMVLGLATYAAGYNVLPPDKLARRTVDAKAAALSAAEWRAIAGIAIAAGLTVFQSIAFYQNTNINLVWIDDHVDLNILGFRFPVAWFNSIDSLVALLLAPPLIAVWRWQASRGWEPGSIAKIGIGAFIAAFANLLLVPGCLGPDKAPVILPIVYDVLLGVAFLYYWPTLLSLASGSAPRRIRATVMGAIFLSLFVADLMVGWTGSFYERMSPAAFWAMNAGISATGGILTFALNRPLKWMLGIAGR